MPELRDYQINHLAFAMSHKRSANTSDPGVGKTAPACVFIYWLWKEHKAKTMFIMPKSLMKKNKREMKDWSEFKDEEIVIIDGSLKERRQQMESKDAKVFLMGFKRFSDDWKTLKKLHPDINAVVIDEVHMGFSTNDSVRTQELYKCMTRTEWFLALSGTLVAGRLDAAFPTIQIIDGRYYYGHKHFLAQHAVVDWNGRTVGWKNHEKVAEILTKICVRTTAKEVYGTEEPQIQIQYCEMTEKHRAVYKEFEEFALLELGDGNTLEAFHPGPHTIRCRQILAHPHALGIMKESEPTSKEEALIIHACDHLERKEPLLVYAVFKEELDRIVMILEKTGMRVGKINSDVKTELRDKYDQGFVKGEYDALVVSPETAAVGYNWGHVNHIIFASLDYKDVNLKQAIRRAIRGVRTIPLIVTVLTYEDTIDTTIFKVLNRKSSDLSKVDRTYEELSLGQKKKEEAIPKTEAVDFSDLVSLSKRLGKQQTN